MNGLSNVDETCRAYYLAPTDDLVIFCRSNVKVTAGRRGGKGFHVFAWASKYLFLFKCNVSGLMDERPDLLLGIIVRHVAKQQQQQQVQQPVAGKVTAKTWMYNEQQEHAIIESPVTLHSTPTTTTTSSMVIHETETIASPASQVRQLLSFTCQPGDGIFYPHMPIGKVWIYRLLFLCLFVWLRISLARIKLAASNFARWFMGVLGRYSPILGTLLPQNPKIGQIGHPPGSKVQGGKSSRNHVRINTMRHVDVGSACVDKRPSQKTDVLVSLCIKLPVVMRWRCDGYIW